MYQAGRIAYETGGANTTLATFTYSPTGTPTSVTVGSNPSTDPRYYYVYNPHGDVVALVDGGGTTVATYSYNEYGTPTIWESFTNGWHNPYLYDGLDRVRYDSETGLYWMSVRAYDPTLGRFISHDPLGRAPLFFDASQPYAYGGNNPLNNVDPSGQWGRRNYLPDGGDWTLDPVDGSGTTRVQTVQPPIQSGNQQLVASAHGAGTPAPYKPSKAQIDKAKQDAAFIGGFLEGQGLFLTFLSGIYGLRAFLHPNESSIASGLIVIAAQAGLLGLYWDKVFSAFSDTDSFWNDRANIINVHHGAELVISIVAIIAVAAGIAMLREGKAPEGGWTDNNQVAFWFAGGGLLVGGIMGLVGFWLVEVQAIDGILKDLGYQGYVWADV